MNPFTSKDVPYALVLLVTVFTWLAGTSLTEMKSTIFLSYQTDVSTDTPVMFVLTLRNDSVQKPLMKASFSVVCPDTTACLAPIEQADSDFGQLVMIPPANLNVTLSGDERGLQVDGVDLLAGTSLQVMARLSSQIIPELYYNVPGNAADSPVISSQPSHLAWLARNYVTVLLALSLVALAILAFWFVAAIFSRKPTAS